MHFLTISLFELGQFLRIALWIALPMVMLSVLVTVYMQYRKGAAQKRLPEVVFGDAGQEGFPEVLAKLHPTAEEQNYKLKQSLIDQASAGDMLEEKNLQIGFLQSQLDQRVKSYQQLEVQGRNNKERLEELQGQYVQALQLLHKIRQELDRLSEGDYLPEGEPDQRQLVAAG